MGANGATEPGEFFDLDALERDSTIPEPFRFQAGGHSFTMAPLADLDWHIQKALAEGDAAVMMAELLGDQFPAFDELDMPSWKLDKLVEAWGRHNGIDVPESGASSASSRNTGQRSRPTSARTTASGSRTSRRGG
jgi:hypothetical protein